MNTPQRSSFDVVGNTEGRTSYYEHETGTDQNKNGTITAVVSNISSGDFDITKDFKGAQTGMPDLRGDGEFIMNKKIYTRLCFTNRHNKSYIKLRNFKMTRSSSSLGPFDITSSTTKVDTRARARAISLKIENTAATKVGN